MIMYPSYPAYPWTDPRAKDMKMDVSPPYSLYQPGPYGGNYPPFHGCCNHAYYGGGPYGYYPPPPPYHPHGFYPPFPAPYPPYSVPPQHYSVEAPRYDYDKNNHHCCGCNHRENDKRPDIKDESQFDRKTTDSSLVPFPLLLKDHPDYPVVWLPRGYADSTAKEMEHDPVSRKHSQPSKPGGLFKHRPDYPVVWLPRGYDDDSKAKDMKHDGVSVKHPQPSKPGGDDMILKDRPDYPVVWLPRGYADSTAKEMEHDGVSVKNPQPSKPGGDDEMAEGEHGNRFPFQIFWLPSKDDVVENNDSKKNNLDLVANKDEKTRKNDECSGGEGESKKTHVVQKMIPVKQGGSNEEKKKPKSAENSDSVENGNRASPKASKLPPVCLRIDPLPKNKKGSRSPSPRSPTNNPKSKKSEEEISDGNIKTIDRANKVELAGNVPREEDGNEKPKVEKKKCLSGDGSEKPKVEDKKNLSGDGNEKPKVEKKNLSGDEAALIIQSAYRGYEVRKSEPLKKLSQIYQVRKQVLELRNRIQGLESSSCVGQKEVAIIGETIMSLLLKLDTIQGLHPFVREVRKSVAKELVGLQEKLDSLTPVKSETPRPQSDSNVPKATESQCDDNNVEAHDNPKLEQQLEKSTVVQDKLDEAPTESDTVNIHEVEATIPQGEPQLGLHKDKLPTVCGCDDDDGLRLLEMEATESQGGIVEPQSESHKEVSDDKSDEVPRLCEANEAEVTKSQEGCHVIGEPTLKLQEDKFDQVPSECDSTNEVEATGPQGGIGGTKSESHNEVLDGKSDESEADEAEVTKSQESCHVIDEPPLELKADKFDQVPSEVEATGSQGAIGRTQSESHGEVLDGKSDEALGLSEANVAEVTKSQEGGHVIGEPTVEPHKDKFEDRECGNTNEIEDTYGEHNAGEMHVDDDSSSVVQCEAGIDMLGCDAESCNVQKDEVSELVMKSDELTKEDDLVQKANEERNGEKVIEELMNRRIRELTGRVKELEKKLSKRNKRRFKLNKCRSRSRGCVIEKDRIIANA